MFAQRQCVKKTLGMSGNMCPVLIGMTTEFDELCLGAGQSSPFNSRSQARIKEEGWRQEGHPAIKPLL